MNKTTWRIVLAGVCTAVTGIGLASPALAQVHAGDQLQVTVYNHPELSRRVTVGADDTLSLPLAGIVHVRGLETAQIAGRIAGALGSYVKHPAVDVELSGQTASLFVSGGPGGVLKYQPGETLAAALADLPGVDGATDPKAPGLAGLARSRVDLHKVGVVRDGASLGTYDALRLSARGQSGPGLLPGDTITLVNKPNTIRVDGAVRRPGFTYLSADEPLADAIDQAGGLTDSAASANVLFQRDGRTDALALGAPTFAQPARNGDMLTVPTAPRVSVVGLVEKPGVFALKTDFSLLNALYQAGGPTRWADLSKVTVTRKGTQTPYNLAALAHGNLTQNAVLQDGDLVFVPEGHKVDFQPIFQGLLSLLYVLPK